MFNYSLFRRSWKLCDTISIINFGKKIKEDSKENLLNIISNKTVSFVIKNNFSIPSELNEFQPIKDGFKLTLNYDKNETDINSIIKIINNNNIDFTDNTSESDLEDVFLNL